MLPNHSPLVVAEQFGTLESLYPGRIDLALGRAPGSDQVTARALRPSPADADAFPSDVLELIQYFKAPRGQQVRAIPGAGLDVPVWILGSSDFGARLAAELGLPYAFASHFAPALMADAIAVYRSRFRPTAAHPRPYLMLAANIAVAGTDEEAAALFSSHQQAFVNLRRGTPGPLPPPSMDRIAALTPAERWMVDQALAVSMVGSPETVRAAVGRFVTETRPDELMLVSQIYDHAARLESYELAARVLMADRADVTRLG